MPTFSTDPRARAAEERCVADVAQHGLHVIKVGDAAADATFAYTVGLHRTFGHPEVILLGLDLDVMHALLNDLADELRRGARFAADDVSDAFLEGYDVTFRPVPARQYRPYLGWANWFNGGTGYPALQMIYPDRERRWPWAAGVSAAFRAQQPVLEEAPAPPWARTSPE